MSLPLSGEVTGEWDLRGRENEYLGFINLKKKRVFELGTASGHLCYFMENQGAEVVGYDLSENQKWDLVPFYDMDNRAKIEDRKKNIQRLNNSWWLAHQEFNSSAKVVYGTIYDIPEGIGEFDICTFGSILLHLQDPFRALHQVTSRIRESIVVSELHNPDLHNEHLINKNYKGRSMYFLPDAETLMPTDTWWNFSSSLMMEYLKILGFPHIQITYHRQMYHGKENDMFTITAHRKPEFIPANLPNGALESFSTEGAGSLQDRVLRQFTFRQLVRHLVKRARKRILG